MNFSNYLVNLLLIKFIAFPIFHFVIVKHKLLQYCYHFGHANKAVVVVDPNAKDKCQWHVIIRNVTSCYKVPQLLLSNKMTKSTFFIIEFNKDL